MLSRVSTMPVPPPSAAPCLSRKLGGTTPDASYAQSGTISLGHADVSLSASNLAVVSSPSIYQGAAAGAASLAVALKGQSASTSIYISNVALGISALSASANSRSFAS